jgi:hypothetical protein
MQPAFEVAQVLNTLGDEVDGFNLNTWKLRTLRAVQHCRTAALGGHIDACDDCGHLQISYNSCRNRHCPKCQGHKREEWIASRTEELLPVPYFHVVFTLPQELNSVTMQHPRAAYDALFDAAWSTLHSFCNNLGVKAGMIAVLHTWGQNLSLHPHLHCIVPGGGIKLSDHNWKNIRADGKFLFPVKAMAKVFRARYVKALAEKITIPKNIRQQVFSKNWVVYAKKPFGSSAAVVEYLGRYTHKVAISNHRIKNITRNAVTFSAKDYRNKGMLKNITLTNTEFIRRFALHILPKRFVKIRHYGFLSSTWKRSKLKDLQQRMKVIPLPIKIETKLRKCPCCLNGNLITLEMFSQRGPPHKNKSSASQTSTPCIQ